MLECNLKLLDMCVDLLSNAIKSPHTNVHDTSICGGAQDLQVNRLALL